MKKKTWSVLLSTWIWIVKLYMKVLNLPGGTKYKIYMTVTSMNSISFNYYVGCSATGVFQKGADVIQAVSTKLYVK